MSMKKVKVVYLIWIAVQCTLYAQFPSSSLYMFDYEVEDDSLFLYNAAFLTSFNLEGYNNQPAFIDNNVVYLTSNVFDTDGTEILMLELDHNQLYRVTETYEQEFSPTLAPSGKHFSTVRIERNGRDQSLWLYPLDRTTTGRRLMENLNNVGYHLWISNVEVVLYLVDYPSKLVLANTETEEFTQLMTHVGRCFKLSPDGDLLFIHKLSTTTWYLKSFDLTTGETTLKISTLQGQEDFDVLPDGSVIMGSGSSIYRYVPGSIGWKKMDDLADTGITEITRIAVSSDKLIIVNADK